MSALTESAQIFAENVKEIREGRPTKYRPEYCDLVIKYMGEGHSYESFAGIIGVHVDTLYEWEKAVYPETYEDKSMVGKLKYPEFSEAKKIAFGRNRVFWEDAGVRMMWMGAKDTNATVWIFNMKNRFKWRDNVDVTTDGQKVDTLNGLLSLLNTGKTGSSSESTD